MVRVVVESGRKRTFASALDWPGWARSGRTEEAALEALSAYAARYAPVAEAAGLAAPEPRLEVVERVSGDATTDFGAPGAICQADSEALDAREAERLARLVEAAWATFDAVVAAAPAELRKGPRGGGRDRDQVAVHVVDAEKAYARRLGVSGQGGREEILEAIRAGHGGRWPARYAARRIAWHVLDHAWEVEDRS